MPRLTTHAPARRGVTLVELLVTLVLLGIVGAGILRTLTKQQQVYKDQSGLAVARRELRIGSGVLPQDLRSVSSSGGDIAEMGERRFGFAVTFGSGVACAMTGNTVTLLPTNLANNVLTSWLFVPLAGDTVWLYDENVEKGSEDDRWLGYQITDVSTSATACPGAPYADPALDAPGAKPRYVFTVNTTVQLIPPTAQVGAMVRFTRQTRYEIFQTGSANNSYLGLSEYVNGGWTAIEPIAGPFRAFQSGDVNPTGLQFRYFDSTGTRLTNIAQKLGVARVDVYLRAAGGTSSLTERAGALITDSTVFRIGLRNFK